MSGALTPGEQAMLDLPGEVPISDAITAGKKLIGATDKSRTKNRRSTKNLEALLMNKAKEYGEMRGYFAFRVDRTVTDRFGRVFTKDLLGFMDQLWIKQPWETVVIAVQVTTEADVRAHENKIFDPTAVVDKEIGAAVKNVERFLNAGGKLLILGFEQPKGKGTEWIPVEHWYTLEDVQEHKARRAGQAAKRAQRKVA